MENLPDSSIKKTLIKLLDEKQAKIGIIGLGYVGLPLSLTFAEQGYKVLGIDVDKSKVKLIKSGSSYLKHIEHRRVSNVFQKNNLNVTSDFKRVKDVDAIILCLPTPLNKFREPDLSFINQTLNSIKSYIRPGQVLSLESTTYPGTTEEVLKPILEKENLNIGEDYFLVYSPEREDPGNKDFNTSNIPKVVGGTTTNCLEVGLSLYQKIISELVPVSSTQAAEMTKLLENIHRAVNIGLINELKVLTEKMSLDLYEIIKAASTKPFGFVPYFPGPGLGGHCIPIDPFYLTWKAKEYGMNTRFIELAGEINSSMPEYVTEKISSALNQICKSINGSKILVLGISYKKNIDDLRESPSLEVIKILKSKGGLVDFSDPFFSELPNLRKYSYNLKSINLNKDSLNSYDLILLATDHDAFDYELIRNNSKLIVDTRGRFKTSKTIFRA